MADITNEGLAQLAYSAYGQATDGLNYQGKPMPNWDELPISIQIAWEVAARAVRSAVKPDIPFREVQQIRRVRVTGVSRGGRFYSSDIRVIDSSTGSLLDNVRGITWSATAGEVNDYAILHCFDSLDPSGTQDFYEKVIVDEISLLSR